LKIGDLEEETVTFPILWEVVGFVHGGIMANVNTDWMMNHGGVEICQPIIAASVRARHDSLDFICINPIDVRYPIIFTH
jgi:hypothetical protein